MSLKKKILLSFFVSAAIIALLSAFLYLNFVEIRKETSFLELTDSIRSKSLQLRRHEKNYFLYAPAEASGEITAIYRYLDELDDIINGMNPAALERGMGLKELILSYPSTSGRYRPSVILNMMLLISVLSVAVFLIFYLVHTA